jgi:hypothetical protein
MSGQRRRREHHLMAVEPLTITLYGKDGGVLLRKQGLRQGSGFDVPVELRKRVARTETFDARGRVVDQWTAPWDVEG